MENKKSKKNNKKFKITQIILILLTFVFVFVYFNKNINIFTNKDEILNDSKVIAQQEEKITALKNELNEEKNRNIRKISFSNLFTTKLTGNYTINGKTGKISMAFEDNFYGKLSFSVKYNTEDKTLMKEINDGNLKIVSPIISFKIGDMNETEQRIELKAENLEQPFIKNKSENGSSIENISFYMLDDSEIEPFNLRGWFINNVFVGDIVNNDNIVIGTFEMNIKEDIVSNENQQTEEIENPK